ncbi:MAG TPA: RHS repeat-associated core domain-containing protein, partial [Streptosporangiaceae bacterium]|nr:RHS repeat-associated core domain-containing protein [Streptosporangiaceae bacterium]
AAGTTSYAYTASGALTTITPPASSAQSFTSNAFSQIATATVAGTTTSYGYDGFGRLGTTATGSSTASLAYSGLSDTVASDGTTGYSYDPSGNLIGLKIGTSAAESAMTDSHGDLVAGFAPASGTSALTASHAFSPYGTVAATAGTMPALGFQSQYTDPGTGDVLMGARWYSPSTGSFTTNDTIDASPVAYGINPSPYGYASDNPLTWADPSGHYVPTPVLIGADAAAGIVEAGVAAIAALAWGTYNAVSGYDVPSTGWWSGLADVNYSALSSLPDINYSGLSGVPDINYSGLENLSGLSGVSVGDIPGADYSSYGGPCALGCFFAPPPPPPPPQDIYALGVAAPTAPQWMRTDKYVTDLVRNDVDIRQLFEHGDHIVEQAQATDSTPAGSTSSLTGTGTTTTNIDITLENLPEVGAPSVPSAPSAGMPITGPSSGPGRKLVPPRVPPSTAVRDKAVFANAKAQLNADAAQRDRLLPPSASSGNGGGGGGKGRVAEGCDDNAMGDATSFSDVNEFLGDVGQAAGPHGSGPPAPPTPPNPPQSGPQGPPAAGPLTPIVVHPTNPIASPAIQPGVGLDAVLQGFFMVGVVLWLVAKKFKSGGNNLDC